MEVADKWLGAPFATTSGWPIRSQSVTLRRHSGFIPFVPRVRVYVTIDLESEEWSVTRTDLLRFNGAVERDPAIDAWMKEHAGELGTIAHQWFEVMQKCGDEVRELLHDGRISI